MLLDKSKSRKYILINRKGNNKFLLNNKPINKTISERLSNIYIPPTYKKILLSRKNNSKIQAIVEDTKGRNQYIYHPNFTKKIESRKYKDLYPLGSNINKIILNNEQFLNNISLKSDKVKQRDKDIILNLVIYMLLKYNFRIGNEKYEELYNSRGITTLKHDNILDNIYDYNKSKYSLHYNDKINNKINKVYYEKQKKQFLRDINILEHVNNTHLDNISNLIILKYNNEKVNEYINSIDNILIKNYLSNKLNYLRKKSNNGYIINFIGKKGMPNTSYDNNMKVYGLLNKLRNSEYIFSLADKKILTSEDIQEYFENNYKIKITPKMFRTWFANYYMLEYLANLNKEILNNQKNILSKKLNNNIPIFVSYKLNNTPSVCKNKYINNKLFKNIINNPKYYINKCNQLKTKEKLNDYLLKLLY